MRKQALGFCFFFCAIQFVSCIFCWNFLLQVRPSACPCPIRPHYGAESKFQGFDVVCHFIQRNTPTLLGDFPYDSRHIWPLETSLWRGRNRIPGLLEVWTVMLFQGTTWYWYKCEQFVGAAEVWMFYDAYLKLMEIRRNYINYAGEVVNMLIDHINIYQLWPWNKSLASYFYSCFMRYLPILLMEEILHHLGCIDPCK